MGVPLSLGLFADAMGQPIISPTQSEVGTIHEVRGTPTSVPDWVRKDDQGNFVLEAQGRGFAAGAKSLAPNDARESAAPEGETTRVGTVEGLFDAIGRLAPGGTILLADGHYQLSRPLVLDQLTNVVLRGASGTPDNVVLTGQGWERGDERDDILHIGRCERVTIADLSFSDCRSYGIKVEAERGPTEVHILNCRFRDIGVRAIKGSAGQDPSIRARRGSVRGCDFENSRIPPADWLFGGDYIAGIDMMALEDWTLSDNVFRNIRGRHGGGRAAIFIWVRSQRVVVERNLIVNCDRGISFGNPGQSTANNAGEQLAYVSDSVIRNNFIVGGADCGIELWHANRITVFNNTIWRPERHWNRGIRMGIGTTDIEIANNLVSGAIQAEGGEARVHHNVFPPKSPVSQK